MYSCSFQYFYCILNCVSCLHSLLWFNLKLATLVKFYQYVKYFIAKAIQLQYFTHHSARFVILQNTRAKYTNLHAKFQTSACEIFQYLSKPCNFALHYHFAWKIWQSAIFHEIVNFNRICISLKLAKFHD